MNNIKLLRVTNGITQLKLNMETGIGQSTLSAYENGEKLPTAENLIILANYYNTNLDYLVDLTDIKDPLPRKKK